jgi:hypothetical protein
MPRGLILGFVFSFSACAAILPARLGPYQLQPIEMKGPATSAPMAEYGADGWDGGNYGSFTLDVWRFKDVTGAFAASLEPTAKSDIRVGNYLVSCSGQCPKNLAALADASLPHISHGALPSLPDYFPAKKLVPGSARYILGPVSLAANIPEIPASAVNFDFGTEGEIARYRTGSGTALLAIFSFPTPSIARQQLPQFQKVPNATVKRTGPMIAVTLGRASEAAKLAESINYAGVVQENEKPPDKPLELKPESAGKMVLAILSLAGLLLAFCLVSGLAVGGSLRLARKFGYSGAEGSLITLHIEGK